METPQTILKNIKMTELADALGLKLSTVSRVVHGNRLSIPTGQAIADHLGRSIEDLFPAIHEKMLHRDRRNQEVVEMRQVHNTDDLRKACKHLMVDHELDREGSYDILLPHISRVMGRQVSKSVLCMALSGYRKSALSHQVLATLQELLSSWPPDQGNTTTFLA
jgi:transcriptional regulator with XRE-family HTH domain